MIAIHLDQPINRPAFKSEIAIEVLREIRQSFEIGGCYDEMVGVASRDCGLYLAGICLLAFARMPTMTRASWELAEAGKKPRIVRVAWPSSTTEVNNVSH